MTHDASRTYPRGSEWRQWDLHVHTPASFQWQGKKFKGDMNSPENIELVDEMIHALNNAKPAVFALMDYWTFDGWFALKARLRQPDAPKLNKTVFPGIELRITAPKGRLNAHAIFSDMVDDQILRDFKSNLLLELMNSCLSNHALIQYARAAGADKISKGGHSKQLIDSDEEYALRVGSQIAEITRESYKDAISRVPTGLVKVFMPFDTNDGLTKVANWYDHYAYANDLFKFSDIFETRNVDLIAAFNGVKTPQNEGFFDAFRESLDNVSRLAVSGSDAHRFVGVAGDNNKRGYGDFPSGKITWIKADPTFLGLLQAMQEPAKRCFIGTKPPKLIECERNSPFFIDTVSIQKTDPNSIGDTWLDGCDIKLNQDLVVIIGNKGSGKSALADVIAMLGHSSQSKHFSFLRPKRFLGNKGEPAKHFQAALTWRDNTTVQRHLANPAELDQVERVQYIPQGHFENLCNEHEKEGVSDFERELRKVIFSHTPDAMRLDAKSFDELARRQEAQTNRTLTDLRQQLKEMNQKISRVEDELQPAIKSQLEKQILFQEQQIAAHESIKPPDMPQPNAQKSPEQQAIEDELNTLTSGLREIEALLDQNMQKNKNLAARMLAIGNLRYQLTTFDSQYKQLEADTLNDVKVADIQLSTLIQFNVNLSILDDQELLLKSEQQKNAEEQKVALATKLVRQQELDKLKQKLDAPQLAYQQYLLAKDQWQKKLHSLQSDTTDIDSLLGLQHRLAELGKLPSELIRLRKERVLHSTKIFRALELQRKSREELFAPLQKVIENNKFIDKNYKLQFQAKLSGSVEQFSDNLFSLIQQMRGSLRGEDGYAFVRSLADQSEFDKEVDVSVFLDKLHEELQKTAGQKKQGISSLLRKGRSAADVYDVLYGLEFLTPKYSILFQDTEIEQLSPGQRGALLLIFYLLVDQNRHPIVLDQPEENLDNETVVNLLVPVLTEAKNKRQIIMVTHNPNLAVVCDAEQIVYASFDRKSGYAIQYSSGSIESSDTNAHVVKILEGTKPAFNNRRQKYH